MQYWWIVLLVLVACAAEGFAVYAFRFKSTLSLILVIVIAAFVMGYKTYEFAGYRINGIAEYPIEFSHISYFIFGTVAILGLRRLYGLAGYCATLTGFGNIIALCVSVESMIEGFRSVGYFALSVVLHNLMFFGGLLLLCDTVKFRMKDIWTVFVAVAAICGFAQLVNAGLVYGDIDYKDSLIILKIMDGRILEYVISADKLTVAAKVVGTVCILLAVCGTIVLYFWGNNRIYDKREEAALGRGYDITCAKIGIVPLTLYAINKVKNKDNKHGCVNSDKNNNGGESALKGE